MALVEEAPIEYDKWGRMKYHPNYHTSHGTRFSQEELIYLCKYWAHDDWQDMSFALGRTQKTLAEKVSELRKKNLYEVYKNMELSDEE